MPTPPVSSGVPGWFGKMPALGDFASRRLPPAWVAAWDDWLQHQLLRSRAALGDDGWLSLYLVAPVRRFWLAPGLLAPSAWLGVLMPSVDSVGRHYPFTLAVALPSPGDLGAALANDGWLAAADALARRVLDPAFDVPALEQALAAMAPPRSGPGGVDPDRWLAHEVDDARPGSRSAWWCDGAAQVADFVTAAALPVDAAFDALLQNPPDAM